MPITGPASYVPTCDEFLTHWDSADTLLGAGNEIVLRGGITRSILLTKKNALVAKRSLLTDKINLRQAARGALEIKKTAMREWVVRFNEAIRADFAGTKWIATLPQAPSQSDGQGVFVEAVEDIKSVWTQLNADPAMPAPLTLLGGYDLAAFTTDVTALGTGFTDFNNAEKVEDIVREERNDLQDEIYDIFKKYRRKLPTKFAKNHALVDSLPRLTPARGRTPAGVILTGEWVEEPGYLVLMWTASDDPDLKEYQVRMSIGPDYDTDSDDIIATLQPGTLTYQTIAGLAGPGDVASFKVYVVLNTGREKGSNTVTITRP